MGLKTTRGHREAPIAIVIDLLQVVLQVIEVSTVRVREVLHQEARLFVLRAALQEAVALEEVLHREEDLIINKTEILPYEKDIFHFESVHDHFINWTND